MTMVPVIPNATHLPVYATTVERPNLVLKSPISQLKYSERPRLQDYLHIVSTIAPSTSYLAPHQQEGKFSQSP